MSVGIVPQEFDPAHIEPSRDRGYTEVFECNGCGVIGDILYRSPFRPCPRCGSWHRPKSLSATWLVSERRVMIRRVWWNPATWSGYRIERTGVWVRAA